MAQTKTTVDCSFTSNTWYKCPISVTIFCLFLFIFIYSLVVLVDTSKIITDKDFSEEKYKKSLSDIFVVYIINIVVTFISLIVILYYLYKIIPDKYVENVFNDFVGILFALYIIIVSSWTIQLYNHAENVPKNEIRGFAGAALFVSLLVIVLFIVKIAKEKNLLPNIQLNPKKSPQAPKGLPSPKAVQLPKSIKTV